MDPIHDPVVLRLLLISAAVYGVTFIGVCVLIPPHPRLRLGSFVLDLCGGLVSGVLAALVFSLTARVAWDFVTSRPLIFGLGLPFPLGLGLGIIYARARRFASLSRGAESPSPVTEK